MPPPSDFLTWCPSHVGYLSVNFNLLRPLCCRLRPDVHDRQTPDVRRASWLNAPYLRGGGIRKRYEQSNCQMSAAQQTMSHALQHSSPKHTPMLLVCRHISRKLELGVQ